MNDRPHTPSVPIDATAWREGWARLADEGRLPDRRTRNDRHPANGFVRDRLAFGCNPAFIREVRPTR